MSYCIQISVIFKLKLQSSSTSGLETKANTKIYSSEGIFLFKIPFVRRSSASQGLSFHAFVGEAEKSNPPTYKWSILHTISVFNKYRTHKAKTIPKRVKNFTGEELNSCFDTVRMRKTFHHRRMIFSWEQDLNEDAEKWKSYPLA